MQDDARVFSVRRRDDLDPRELGGLEVSSVRAAAVRLAGMVVRTPVVRHPVLDAIAGCELWLKAENLQRIGA
ncbi:MAG: hypothetical protein IAG13_17515, partial [Deltaproteobacteria bacterium]|nr:hypothetical protein [Nannocystaceae bacterium]